MELIRTGPVFLAIEIYDYIIQWFERTSTEQYNQTNSKGYKIHETICVIKLREEENYSSSGVAIWNNKDSFNSGYAIKLALKRALQKGQVCHSQRTDIWKALLSHDEFVNDHIKAYSKHPRSAKLPSQLEGHYFRHRRTGEVYRVCRINLLTQNSKKQWVPALMYEKDEQYIAFIRPVTTFLNKFELVS